MRPKESLMTRIHCFFAGGMLILVLAVLAVVPPSKVGAQGKKPILPNSNFDVVDSAGLELGRVVGVMQGIRLTIVAVPWRGTFLPVEVLRRGYAKSTLVYFTSNNCTGQPYTTADGPFLGSAVSVPGNTLYGQNGPPQMISISSAISDTDGSCIQLSFTDEMAPVEAVLNLDVFTPPFSVIAR
jgi:hypothetical protein